MKATILCFVLTVFTTLLNAQPIITNAYFVKAGDILETRVDEDPDASIMPLGPGEQTWDFTNLSYDNVLQRDSFYAATVGVNYAEFSDAELVRITNGVEFYYNVTETTQEVIGYSGLDPVGIGFVVNARYDKPALFRSAPLENYHNSDVPSALAFTVSTESLPDSLKTYLSSIGDSVRVNINNSVRRIGDGFGSMAIPGGSYEVLRINTLEYRDTRVSIFTALGWSDVTDIVKNQYNIEALGPDTIKHYDFFAEGVTEAIASLYVDVVTDEVERVVYKADLFVATEDLTAPKPSLTAYPNPIEDEVMFQIDNVPSGKYRVKIYNILGSSVWEKSYSVSSGNNLYWENLDGLTKGTYLMSLIDERSHILSTQRLIVIRP